MNMMELTINDKIYEFNFGIGFLRDIDASRKQAVAGVNGMQRNVGFTFAYAGLVDGDTDVLVNILLTANKGTSNRITQKELDAYIDDKSTDIDALFEQVRDFLRQSNACKRKVRVMDEQFEETQKRAKK